MCVFVLSCVLLLMLIVLGLDVVIVFDNGRSGFMGEHSCMDGTPTLRMNEFVLASLAHGKVDLGPGRTAETGAGLAEPVELQFEVNAQVEGLVKEAEGRFDELVGQHDLHVGVSFTFSGAT